MSQRLYTVSIYDTLGPETTEYIINHAGLTSVCASVSHIPTLIKLAPRCPTLKLVISLDPLEEDGEQAGTSKKALLNAMGCEIVVDAIVSALRMRRGRARWRTPSLAR